MKHGISVLKGKHFDFPKRYLTGKPAPCAYCPMRFERRCEFPGCTTVMCAKHSFRKYGGNLCRAHEKAQLQQCEGTPAEDAMTFEAAASTRFKARGPADAHQE